MTVEEQKEKLYAQAEHIRGMKERAETAERSNYAVAAGSGLADQTQIPSVGLGGALAYGEERRPSLRERVSMDLAKAQRESRREMRLAELHELLARNPEVARILDLMEDVRG
jgi:hypothetical protein